MPCPELFPKGGASKWWWISFDDVLSRPQVRVRSLCQSGAWRKEVLKFLPSECLWGVPCRMESFLVIKLRMVMLLNAFLLMAMILNICCIGDTLPIRQLWSVCPIHSDSPSPRTARSLPPPAQEWWALPAMVALQTPTFQPRLIWPGPASHPTQLQPSFHPRNLALQLWGSSVCCWNWNIIFNPPYATNTWFRRTTKKEPS